MCFASEGNKNTWTKNRSLRKWKGILVQPLSHYFAAVILAEGDPYLIFTWHFMFF